MKFLLLVYREVLLVVCYSQHTLFQRGCLEMIKFVQCYGTVGGHLRYACLKNEAGKHVSIVALKKAIFILIVDCSDLISHYPEIVWNTSNLLTHLNGCDLRLICLE